MARITNAELARALTAATSALHTVETQLSAAMGKIALLEGTQAPHPAQALLDFRTAVQNAPLPDSAPPVVLTGKSDYTRRCEEIIRAKKRREALDRKYATQPLSPEEQAAYNESRLITKPVWGANTSKAQAYCAAHGVKSVTAAELNAWQG